MSPRARGRVYSLRLNAPIATTNSGGHFYSLVPPGIGCVRTTQIPRRTLSTTKNQKTRGISMTMGFSTSDDAANAPAERMTGSQAIVRTLEDLGVTDVFGLPGGAILPTYDPLYDSKKVRHILVRHEQAAGHAAQGYAVSSGKTGVCIATSGPGATNLLTAIADANMDSIPWSPSPVRFPPSCSVPTHSRKLTLSAWQCPSPSTPL